MILLNAPYDPGDLDAGQTYTHVKVLSSSETWHPGEGLVAYWAYGTVVDSAFVEGKSARGKVRVSVEDWASKIDGMLSAGGGEKSYAAWTKALHQLLLDENVVEGTLV